MNSKLAVQNIDSQPGEDKNKKTPHQPANSRKRVFTAEQ